MTQNDPSSPATRAARMSAPELRAAAGLGAVFFLRMLGLFMILPVLPLHAGELAGATPFTAGLALGAYGMTQALLQIPFGTLSDRFGRKRVISAGLLLFAAGSVVGALADSITGVIAGRLLQGAGAIAAAVMALSADLTREQHRTKAMALIGVSIGFAFILAFVLGPLIDARRGMDAVFWAGAVLALAALVILHLAVPTPARATHHPEYQADPGQLRRVLRDPGLLRLDLGVCCLHLVLTASFVVIPLVLRDGAGLGSQRHWQFYLPVLVASAVLMLPMLQFADRPDRVRGVTLAAIAILGTALAALALVQPGVLALGLALVAFFAAFNLLEASLPAQVSRLAPGGARGTALGVFSTAQFLGSFAGGALGGLLHGALGAGAVFTAAALVCGLWLAGTALARSRPGAAARPGDAQAPSE